MELKYTSKIKIKNQRPHKSIAQTTLKNNWVILNELHFRHDNCF